MDKWDLIMLVPILQPCQPYKQITWLLFMEQVIPLGIPLVMFLQMDATLGSLMQIDTGLGRTIPRPMQVLI